MDGEDKAEASPEERYDPRSLLRRGPALLAIGAAATAIAAALAFTAGWLSPGRLTQAKVVDRFQQVNGLHPGFRRNHSKGVCFTGEFDSDGAGQRISKAVLFAPGRTPVFGRFALATGQPFSLDAPDIVRSMAVDFALKDGEVWRTGMNNIPVFPFRTVQIFYEQLLATRPDPKTGKPAPTRIKPFLAAHPEAAQAIGLIKATPFSSGFADASYNSLNAFRFVDGRGRSLPVRWSMVALDPVRPDAPTPAQRADPNYLFDALTARIRQGPIRWRMVATLADPGDPTDDATRAWPAGRRQVALGVLTLDRLEDEAHGACRDVTFDPLILPAGIAPSDDPILSARSATYSPSLTRRDGEPKTPSAVTYADGSEGAR